MRLLGIIRQTTTVDNSGILDAFPAGFRAFCHDFVATPQLACLPADYDRTNPKEAVEISGCNSLMKCCIIVAVARAWLGTSGFSYKEWRPSFYPKGLPDKQFLQYYATRLNSVEIDYTFYRMPSAKTIETWKNAVPEDFRFTLKASQQITHRERLKIPSDALTYLLGVVPGLEMRLGMILYQLPPFFKCDPQKLETFLSVLPRGMRAAFEFRHDSWFNPDVYRILRDRAVGLCIHDADDHTTPMELTAAFTYLRLRRSAYAADLRQEWQERMRDWVANGVDVFAYIKHEDNPDAPRIALEFAEAFR